MKTSTKIMSGTFALAFVAIAAMSPALAYKGDPAVQGSNYSPERHEAMEEAFEANNYEAWAELMEGRGRMTQVINADNFAQFSEAHELAENGDLEGAKEIRAELGLGMKDGSGQGNHDKVRGRGQGSRGGSGTRGDSENCIYGN